MPKRKNHNGIQSVNQWNADVFSLIFNLYFIDSRYLEQEENVFNPLIWHALLKNQYHEEIHYLTSFTHPISIHRLYR